MDEIPRVIKFIETKSGILVLRGFREGAIGSCGLIGYRVSMLPDQKNFGDCLYKVNIRSVPNCTTKSG